MVFFPFSLNFKRAVVSYWRKDCAQSTSKPLRGLCLPKTSVSRLIDQLNITITVLTGLYNSNSYKQVVCPRVVNH